MDSTPQIDRLLFLGWDLRREYGTDGTTWEWTDPLGNVTEMFRTDGSDTPPLPPNVERYLDPETPLIGLSLSFCVKHIADGRVRLSQVAKIITGTMCETEEHWNDLIVRYRQTYWYDNPTVCESALYWLKSEGQIEQPRLTGGRTPNISRGIWVIDQAHADYRMATVATE